jgi:flavoprotein
MKRSIRTSHHGLTTSSNLNSEVYTLHAQPLDEKCKKLEETIQRVAKTPSVTREKQANKKWFDKECAKVNEEKNAARERAIQIKTRGVKNTYKLARTKERSLFRKKQGSSTKLN